MNLKKFTRRAVITIFIVVIAISFGMRSIFKKVAGAITGGVSQVVDMINITDDGVNIADYIKIDSSGISVGGQNAGQTSDPAGNTGEGDSALPGSFDAIDVTESGFSEKRYTFDPAINRALDISVSGCSVAVASGDYDSIIIDVLESDDFHYDFSTSSNTLLVRDEQSQGEKKEVNIFGYKLSLGTTKHVTKYTGLAMVVYLPKDFSGDISVSTSDGELKLGNLKLDEKLSVTTSGSHITLSDIEAYEIDASTSNGRISLSRLSATEINVRTSEGRLNLEDLTVKRLSAITSNASIDFSRLFGEKFNFETSNGDIDGSILGTESLFQIETETDRTAYPKSSENPRAQYKLTAKTSGGDINIRFTE